MIYGLNGTSFERNPRKPSFEILGSYPDLSDEKNQSICEENNYIASLDIICFPETQKKKLVEHFNMFYPMDSLCKANYFHFITTNSLGQQKYLTSVNFKELYLSDSGAYVV